MKRLLLTPLLLTLIFSCGYKESVLGKKKNPIVNLECTLTDYSRIHNGGLIYETSLSEEDYQSGPILISFNKESFGWVTVDHKRLLEMRNGNRADYEFTDFKRIKTTKDLIKFKHSRTVDDERVYEINRTNGKIVYIFSLPNGESIYNGKCKVLEDEEPLF